MVKESVTIKETVDFLNELLECDANISALFDVRLSCNKTIADHDTVQVRMIDDNLFQVGMLGILNGLFGKDKHGWGHIAAEYKDNKIIKFRLLTNEDVKSYVKK